MGQELQTALVNDKPSLLERVHIHLDRQTLNTLRRLTAGAEMAELSLCGSMSAKSPSSDEILLLRRRTIFTQSPSFSKVQKSLDICAVKCELTNSVGAVNSKHP